MNLIDKLDSNANAEIVLSIVNKVHEQFKDIYWLITDVEISPAYHDDYPGSGEATLEETAYHFMLKMMNDRIAILSHEELCKILADTDSIDNIVLICFSYDIQIDVKSLEVCAENLSPNEFSHNECICEFRVFDGGSIPIFLSNYDYLYDIVLKELEEE